MKRILQDKAQQNVERKRNLILMANKSLAESTVYMNGGKHDMGQTTDGKTKVVNAFQDLIKMVKVFDVYEGNNIPVGKKSIALNVTIQSLERTLKDEDLDKINQLIISTVADKTGAKIRS